MLEQFLLFPQRFQKTCTADMLKRGLVWERVKSKISTKVRRQILVTSIFSFYPAKFSNGFFLWVNKSRIYAVEGYILERKVL